MVALNVFIIMIAVLFFREFTAISFDEEFATVIGIPVKSLYLFQPDGLIKAVL